MKNILHLVKILVSSFLFAMSRNVTAQNAQAFRNKLGYHGESKRARKASAKHINRLARDAWTILTSRTSTVVGIVRFLHALSIILRSKSEPICGVFAAEYSQCRKCPPRCLADERASAGWRE
jgi:hypothetical protein